MPGCLLNASGADFDVDAFLKTSPWRDVAVVHHRGEPTGIKLRPVTKYSGFRIDISDPEEDQMEPQIRDATKFLQENGAELERLTAFPGIDEVELGIGLFWLEDTACYPLSLPPQFLLLAGKRGVSVTLYVYAASAEDQKT